MAQTIDEQAAALWRATWEAVDAAAEVTEPSSITWADVPEETKQLWRDEVTR